MSEKTKFDSSLSAPKHWIAVAVILACGMVGGALILRSPGTSSPAAASGHADADNHKDGEHHGEEGEKKDAHKDADEHADGEHHDEKNEKAEGGHDDDEGLIPPVKFSLEQALEFIDDDELVEVTPKQIRLRKKFRTEIDRKRATRAA